MNHSKSEMIIIHEPECVEFSLPAGEEVEIVMQKSCKSAIALRYSVFEGKVYVSILDHRSDYQVLYKGENAFSRYDFD